MPRIIYPEVRTVSEAWVQTQAHDLLVNEALDAEALRFGVDGVPDDYWPQVPMPSYAEAYEILGDSGVVTFASDDWNDDDWRAHEAEARLEEEVLSDHPLDDGDR